MASSIAPDIPSRSEVMTRASTASNRGAIVLLVAEKMHSIADPQGAGLLP